MLVYNFHESNERNLFKNIDFITSDVKAIT